MTPKPKKPKKDYTPADRAAILEALPPGVGPLIRPAPEDTLDGIEVFVEDAEE